MYVQTDRPMRLTTPLGKDALLVTALTGREAISELFHFHLETVGEDKAKLLPFDQLLGQKVTVEMTVKAGVRYFSGIVNRVTQGERDREFTYYRLEVVPQLWLLTRKTRSRIFQHLSVPDILKKVLEGLDVTYEIQGTFEPREYSVQYRETDFNYVSRLMEEEGIYYFFKHSQDGHKLVLANTPQSHDGIPFEETVIYEEIFGHTEEQERVWSWHKAQEIRSGKYVTWDETFQMPGKHLDAEKAIMDSVQAGKATHKLKVGGNDNLEIYEYPGGYAARFDGIDKGGGEKSSNLQKIFADNKRTVDIRMQQEALGSLVVEARGGHSGFTAGCTFTLDRHFSDDGKWVLTSVEHDARQPVGDSDTNPPFKYENQFNCIPFALPYRPLRTTPAPGVRGVQTATVVGPPGEEIFPDKYGRVKVQFHWDREGQNDTNSSCWMRVGTFWAGKQWGAVHIPRIGQEVIVDFLEGDVDRPIIVGSVYNADMMPPYTLPDNKTQSGVKSRSSKGGGTDNFNEIRFEDKKGSEQVFIHAEKNQDIEVEHDETHWVGNDRTKNIDHDETTHVKHDRTETVDHDETITIHGKQTITVDGNQGTTVTQGNRSIELKMGNQSTKIDMGNQSTKIDLGKSEEEAMQSIELKVGQSSIKLDPTGVTIKGMMISVEAQILGKFKAVMTQVNGDAMTQVQGGVVMIN